MPESERDPAPNGVEVTARLRVLNLSASGEQADVLDTVKAGATGYLVTSASRPELLSAVPRASSADPKTPQLTEGETEVLRRVATAMSNKQIAERLFLSHRAVQKHVQNTLLKLHLHHRVQLVRYAIEQGLDDA